MERLTPSSSYNSSLADERLSRQAGIDDEELFSSDNEQQQQQHQAHPPPTKKSTTSSEKAVTEKENNTSKDFSVPSSTKKAPKDVVKNSPYGTKKLQSPTKGGGNSSNNTSVHSNIEALKKLPSIMSPARLLHSRSHDSGLSEKAKQSPSSSGKTKTNNTSYSNNNGGATNVEVQLVKLKSGDEYDDDKGEQEESGVAMGPSNNSSNTIPRNFNSNKQSVQFPTSSATLGRFGASKSANSLLPPISLSRSSDSISDLVDTSSPAGAAIYDAMIQQNATLKKISRVTIERQKKRQVILNETKQSVNVLSNAISSSVGDIMSLSAEELIRKYRATPTTTTASATPSEPVSVYAAYRHQQKVGGSGLKSTDSLNASSEALNSATAANTALTTTLARSKLSKSTSNSNFVGATGKTDSIENVADRKSS